MLINLLLHFYCVYYKKYRKRFFRFLLVRMILKQSILANEIGQALFVFLVTGKVKVQTLKLLGVFKFIGIFFFFKKLLINKLI